MEQLIQTIEAELPGWGWLVRRTQDGDYLANITSPGFRAIVGPEGRDLSEGRRFIQRGASPEEALRRSLRLARLMEGA